MNNPSRKHHYVPRFYLAGFTKTASKDGLLHVVDKELGKSFGPVTPNAIAFENDFYKVEVRPEYNPMLIEQVIAEIEATCSKVVYKLIEERTLPKGTDCETLMNFVALMATRVPGIRRTISGFLDKVMKRFLQTMLKSDVGWKQFVQTCEENGQAVTETREKYIEVAGSEDITIDMDRSWHVGTMLELGSRLVPELAKRHWSLWLAEENTPDLICSDNPVSLSWHVSPHPPLPPGFAARGTLVIMPINRRMAVAGAYETDLPAISYLDKHCVATVNRSTLEYAVQIYSPEKEFTWATTEEHVAGVQDVLELSNIKANKKS